MEYGLNVKRTSEKSDCESVSSQCRWSIALYPLRNQQNEFLQRDEGSYVHYHDHCAPP